MGCSREGTLGAAAGTCFTLPFLAWPPTPSLAWTPVPLLQQTNPHLQYRPACGAWEPKDLPANLATHVLHAFCFLNPGEGLHLAGIPSMNICVESGCPSALLPCGQATPRRAERCCARVADLSPKTLDWRDEVLFGQLRDLKKVNPQLKIMVSIGGS